MMASLNPSWLFTSIGWLDPWIYDALSSDWGNPSTWLTNYKASRLGWVVPAWLASPLSNGYWGQIAFGLLLLVLTGALVGAALTRIWGLRVGIVGGLLVSGWTSLQFMGGTTYHNQATGIWAGAVLLALTFIRSSRRGRSHSVWAILISGVLTGLMLHANPISINIIPFVIIFGIACAHPKRIPRVRKVALASGAYVGGIALATAALMVAAAAVGRDPWFFRQGADLASGLLGDRAGQATWWVPLSLDWGSLPKAGFGDQLILPLLGVLASLIVVFSWRRRFWKDPAYATSARIVAGGSLLTTAIFVGWNAIGQTSLAPSYFSYGLGFVSAIGVALLAARPTGTVSGAPGSWRDAITAGCLGLAFALPMLALPFTQGLLGASGKTLAIAVLIGLFAVAALAYPARTLPWVFIGVVGFGYTNLIATARMGKTAYSWSPPAGQCRGAQSLGYEVIHATNAWVDDREPGFRAVTVGPVWWPAEVGLQKLPCFGGQNVGALMTSWSNTGYTTLPGRGYGDPNRLSDLPLAEVQSFVTSKTTIGFVVRQGESIEWTTGRHHFRVACRHRTTLALDAPRLDLCIGTIIDTPAARR